MTGEVSSTGQDDKINEKKGDEAGSHNNVGPSEDTQNTEATMTITEEFDLLDTKLDQLHSALDFIERKNDDIHERLKELLQSSIDIRQQLRNEHLEAGADK